MSRYLFKSLFLSVLISSPLVGQDVPSREAFDIEIGNELRQALRNQLVKNDLNAESFRSLSKPANVQKSGREVITAGGPGAFFQRPFVPISGPIVDKVSIVENGQKVEKYWASLSPEEWLVALPNRFVETIIYSREKSGSLNLFLGSVSGSKGNFFLRYHNFKYRPYPCDENNPNAGQLYVGVGLRTNIDANFKKKGVGVDFAQIAFGAKSNSIEGQTTFETIGIPSSATLSNVVSDAQGGITYENLIKTDSANLVTEQVLEDMVNVGTPQIFGYKDGVTEGSCISTLLGSTPAP